MNITLYALSADLPSAVTCATAIQALGHTCSAVDVSTIPPGSNAVQVVVTHVSCATAVMAVYNNLRPIAITANFSNPNHVAALAQLALNDWIDAGLAFPFIQ